MTTCCSFTSPYAQILIIPEGARFNRMPVHLLPVLVREPKSVSKLLTRPLQSEERAERSHGENAGQVQTFSRFAC